MSNQWLRLWHDMPTDPKWRTIARLSGESLALVTAVYLHLLVDASRNVTRGNVTVTVEDLASALDVTDAQIEFIFKAMEGRVIVDGYLSGWEKRQPKREDSGDENTGVKGNAQRQKEYRDRQKAKEQQANPEGDVTQSNAASHKVTLDKEEIRVDKRREERNTNTTTSVVTPDGVSDSLWADFKKLRATKKAPITQTAIDGIQREADSAGLSLSAALAMCCERGWTGFKAEWAAQQQSTGQPVNKQEAIEQRNRAVASSWASNSKFAGAI